MIPNEFQEVMRRNRGCAVILAGSYTDEEHIKKIIGGLEQFEVPYWVRIASSHKQPEKVAALIKELNEVRGTYVLVAVAGGQDAVSGIASYNALALVISCPPDAPNDSPLRNPLGSSNVTLYKPGDVGRAVAQTFSGIHSRFRELLQQSINNKVGQLEVKDGEFSKRYLCCSYEGVKV